ncbi:MAG: threonine/serine dehydratase [Acidobacteriota bacterium]|nr:threonine/serine dehydratase [Acidobacteriota bacterium]
MEKQITPSMVREAADRIAVLARRTPVMSSRSVDGRAGMRVHFKCENLQRGGAFKIRGASNLILSTPAEELKHGVVAFSSGNHAQATAIAAKYAGVLATIVMPEDAPRAKMESTRDLGARIITYDRFQDDREAIAAGVLKETGGVLVPPFDHPMIMAGQGTVALELLEEAPDLDALVVCIGGGGLMAGCATIAKQMLPNIRIFGVEPELANDTFQSFARGERVTIPAPDTIADGLRAPAPGKLTFPVIQAHVEKILLVTEEEIRATMRFLLERMKILVEPSGAVAAAAVLLGKLPAGIRSAGVVISGGNVDVDFLKTL